MWVFGDLNKPLLGDVSQRMLIYALLEGRPELADVLSKSNRKASAKSKSSDLQGKREDSLNDIAAIFDRVRGLKPDSFNLRGFTVENLNFSTSTNLSALPWSIDAWTTLSELGFNRDSYIIEIDGLTWFEVIESGGWKVLFEILHNLFDWAPFAYSRDLFVPGSSNLSEFAVFLEKMLHARSGNANFLFEAWSSFIRRRFGWGSESITLEQFGLEIGVTRERVRQLEQTFLLQFQAVNLVAPTALDDFDQLSQTLEILDDSVGLDDFEDKDEIPFRWSSEALSGLVRLYMGNEAYARFRILIQEKKANSFETLKTAKKLKKLRSKLGIMKVNQIREFLVENGVPPDKLEATILSVYPRSVFSGEYVLARTAKHEPLLFNATVRQLAIAQPLHYEVLYRGVEQAARYRSVASDMPGLTAFRSLLASHEDTSVDEAGLVRYSGHGIEVEPDSIRQWLVNELLSCDGNVTSKASLLREAARGGLKFTSVGLYLSYSPEFRAIGDSLYTLVGAEPNSSQLDDARAISAINRVVGVESGLQLQANGDLNVSYVFGTDFLTSGVLSVSSRTGQLIGTSARVSRCCPSYTSESKPKMSGKTFLSNMSGLRDHLWFDHGLREGDRFTLNFSRGQLSVTLGR